MIRGLWVYLVGWLATLYFGTDVIVCRALRLRSLTARCWAAQRGWARAVLWAAGVKVEMSGTENVSTDRAQVLVANHESWFDVFALAGHLPVGAKFVAKHVLERVPFFGGAWRACSHISIDRGDRTSAIQSLRDVGARIGRTGETVLMFPEGTRTTTGELQAFKKGAFVMALESRVPVVPVGISGSRDLMPKGSFRIRSGTVRVRIGEAIPVEGMSHEDRDRLTGLARDAVARLRVAGDIGTVRGEGSRGAIPSG